MFSKADAYERFMGRWSRLLGPALVGFGEVRDGDAVLDVGCGTGSLSFTVRDLIGGARVTGVDPAADYVDHATRQRDDPGVRFEVADARHLPFAGPEFDRTLSALVLNFIPEPERAVREMIRVTKSGGRVAAAVWDYAEGMTMLRAFWDEASVLDETARVRDEAHMPLCARGELAALWRGEGLQGVQESPLSVTLRFVSFDDFWAPFLLGQGPAGAYVTALSQDRRSALEARLRQRLIGSGPDRPIEMQARAWAVKGTVPPK